MLIVFDLDGTLVDSRRDLAESANALLADYGAPPLAEDVIGSMVGDGAPVLVRRACVAAGLSSVPADALRRFLDLYEARLLNNTKPYPGMLETLDGAATKGTLAVLTNKPGAASRRILEGTGLLDFFHQLVCGDGPWARKPEPEGLRWLMEQTRESPASTLFVGDSSVDLRTARAAGVPICLARYGFGYLSVPIRELTATERVIDAPLELLKLLQQDA